MLTGSSRRWLVLAWLLCALVSQGSAEEGWASGVAFLIHPEGYLLTCAHIVRDATSIQIALNGTRYPASLIGTNAKNDLALLKINATRLPYLWMANSNAIDVDSRVHALSFTAASEPGETVKPLTGLVTGLTMLSAAKLFRTDIPVKPGASGAPLLNDRGEVVGIMNDQLVGTESENIGYITPANYAKALIQDEGVPFLAPVAHEVIDERDLVNTVQPALGIVLVKFAHNGNINLRDGAAMVWVGAGEFTMGTSGVRLAPEWENECPQRKVTLDGYWIYKYEVTVAQYRRFCRTTERKMPDPPAWGWLDTHPMVNVSWDDAKAYADWAGSVLPTEAQWEKAARGADARAFPWDGGWDPARCACWDSTLTENALRGTKPVGSFTEDVSPYGAQDMAGNVMEWCADWYDAKAYVTAPASNPTGPGAGTKRVLRGGSWRYGFAARFRCASRFSFDPAYRGPGVGFRCVVASPH